MLIWLGRRNGQMCLCTSLCELKPMTWMHSQGRGKNMIAELVIGKSGKEICGKDSSRGGGNATNVSVVCANSHHRMSHHQSRI